MWQLLFLGTLALFAYWLLGANSSQNFFYWLLCGSSENHLELPPENKPQLPPPPRFRGQNRIANYYDQQHWHN